MIQVLGHKILVRWQEVNDHGVDNFLHHLRVVEDRLRQRVEQHDEGDEGENRVGRHTEGKGVHLAVQQVVDQRRAVLAPVVPLGLLSRLLYIDGSGSLNRRIVPFIGIYEFSHGCFLSEVKLFAVK